MNWQNDFIAISNINKAFTCKTESYKAVWVKGGRCSSKQPSGFDFMKDKVYIIGTGKTIFPENKTYDDIEIEPNYEYYSNELLYSLFPLIFVFEASSIQKQIKETLNWCKKYGFPFIGDSGFYGGNLGTCYKETGHIGFNLMVLKRDLLTLRCFVQKIYRMKNESGTANIESDISGILNISMLNMRQHYTFVNHQLTLETGFTDLISLAYYQLAFILMAPRGASIKKCKQCGAIFVSNNSKKEYCPKHSPQSHYAQKRRMKKTSDTN